MQAKSRKAEPQPHAGSRGGIAAPAQAGIEHVAEFPASVRAAVPEQHHVTGQPARLAHLDADREPLSLIGEFRACPLPRNPLDDVVTSHRLAPPIPSAIFDAPEGNAGGAPTLWRQAHT